jgi:hypothetical protein
VVRRYTFGVVCVAASLVLAQPVIAQEGIDELRDTVDNSTADDFGVQAQAAIPPPEALEEPPPPPRAQRRSIDERQERLGIGYGSVKLHSALETGIVASSNPARSSTKRKADIGLRAAPSLRLESDWSRHAAKLEAAGEFVEYLDQSAASTRQARVQGDLRLDIRSTSFADVNASYTFDQQRDTRSDTGAASAEPRITQTLVAGTGITHDFGNLQGRMGLRLTRFLADDVRRTDGTVEANADREYLAPEISARLSWNPTALFSPFVELATDHRFFDQSRNRFGLKSDSTGLRAAIGVNFNDSPIWEGSLAATWLWRDYDDGTLSDGTAIGVAGSVIWRPSDFASLTFTTGVGLDDTRDSTDPVSRNWNAALAAAYGVTDQLSFNADAKVELVDGAGPVDFTTDVGLGMEWQANTFVAFALRGENTWFEGGGPGDDYTEQRLIASLILER